MARSGRWAYMLDLSVKLCFFTKISQKLHEIERIPRAPVDPSMFISPNISHREFFGHLLVFSGTKYSAQIDERKKKLFR